MAEYIEREALLDRLNKRLKNPAIIGWLCRIIADAPTADVVEVAHGRWEFDFTDIWKCSACGEDWFFEYDPRDDETRVNYCPNCGARMDGAT